nr:MAG TPA: hypothetical protein [Caudoviricetes sp.]
MRLTITQKVAMMVNHLSLFDATVFTPFLRSLCLATQ